MTDNSQLYQSWAKKAADLYGVPFQAFDTLLQSESGYKMVPNAQGSGAFGIAQLMPDTAKSLGVNINNPMQNIYGGAQYFSQMLKQSGGNIGDAILKYKGYSDLIKGYSDKTNQQTILNAGGKLPDNISPAQTTTQKSFWQQLLENFGNGTSAAQITNDGNVVNPGNAAANSVTNTTSDFIVKYGWAIFLGILALILFLFGIKGLSDGK